MKYKTVKALAKAYESGELRPRAEKVVMSEGVTFPIATFCVYENGKRDGAVLFEMPHDEFVRQCAKLAGIYLFVD